MLTMNDIAADTYVITVNSSVRRANEDILKVQVCTDGENWEDAGEIVLTSNEGGDYSIEDITLESDGAIRLVESKSQNMCHYIDYIVLVSKDVVTGADSVPSVDDAVEAIYTAGGAKVSALQPGINIVKMQNGEAKKVLVK